MIKGIYTAARGLDARMKNLDIVANNLANINTTGYKREIPFSEIMNQAGNIQVRQMTDFRPGDLVQTSNPFDLALSGNGFFVVQSDNGMVLTRNGNFQISQDGFLVDQAGNKVLGKNGAININKFLLDKNATVTISKTGEIKSGNLVIDNLLIATPDDPQASERLTGEDFSLQNSGFQIAPENEYEVKQGYLEESNVNPIKEMEAMIQINNEYDSAHKMINYLDKSLDEANQIGKV
ncbi:MAG: flagellar hook basal-body protein [Bacteroidetes bacterium]|nr:flagellar hook basal-body protein [Bacteroidota bacterium]